MSRAQVRRMFLSVGAAIVVLALLATAGGCTAITRYAGSTSDSSVGQEPAPSKYYDEVAGDALLATDEGGAGSAPHGTSSASLALARAGTGSGTLAQEQLIIRTGSMRLRVTDITAAIERIRSATATFGGVIDDLQVSTEADQPVYRSLASGEGGDVVPLGAYATVRVPSKRLDEFTKQVASFGTVVRQSSSQSDVTQQHIDMAARLKNLRAEESRLRDFLNAAKNVKEMLLVQAELSRVRGEIESLQAQLDYLDRQIAYATLSVELVKPAPVVRPSGTDWGFSEAVTNGIQGAAGAVLGIITLSIAALPFVLIALVVYLLVRLAMRRRRRARTVANPDVPGEGNSSSESGASTGDNPFAGGDE